MKISMVAAILIIFLVSCSKEEVALPYEEQLAKDISAIDAYLSSKGVVAEKDISGFRFITNATGSVFIPALEDSVRIKYSLRYLSETPIFSNVEKTSLLSKLIKAFQTQLPRMGEGGSITLYVPSGLAYGAYPVEISKGVIPKNSNLIFDVTLLKVIPEYTKQLKKDTTEIGNYLRANNIAAKKDASGLSYQISSPGLSTALIPLASDSVVITYTGKVLLSTGVGVTFDPSSTSKGYRLSAKSTLKAFQKAFPLFNEGTKATLFVPSGLGFGSYEKLGVPPNTNLLYEVTLEKVIRK
jgi:FKBP-type peptidyl-prolyl cis-trans isomerase FkpA